MNFFNTGCLLSLPMALLSALALPASAAEPPSAAAEEKAADEERPIKRVAAHFGRLAEHVARELESQGAGEIKIAAIEGPVHDERLRAILTTALETTNVESPGKAPGERPVKVNPLAKVSVIVECNVLDQRGVPVLRVEARVKDARGKVSDAFVQYIRAPSGIINAQRAAMPVAGQSLSAAVDSLTDGIVRELMAYNVSSLVLATVDGPGDAAYVRKLLTVNLLKRKLSNEESPDGKLLKLNPYAGWRLQTDFVEQKIDGRSTIKVESRLKDPRGRTVSVFTEHITNKEDVSRILRDGRVQVPETATAQG